MGHSHSEMILGLPRLQSSYPPAPSAHRTTIVSRCHAVITELMILLMAAKKGPNILFCTPNRTKRVLLVSVISGRVSVHSSIRQFSACRPFRRPPFYSSLPPPARQPALSVRLSVAPSSFHDAAGPPCAAQQCAPSSRRPHQLCAATQRRFLRAVLAAPTRAAVLPLAPRPASAAPATSRAV
jgi:hypothetical protein